MDALCGPPDCGPQLSVISRQLSVKAQASRARPKLSGQVDGGVSGLIDERTLFSSERVA